MPVGMFAVRHVFGVTMVTGTSMQPMFNPNLHQHPLRKDIVLLDKLSVRMGNVRRGDIVTMW